MATTKQPAPKQSAPKPAAPAPAAPAAPKPPVRTPAQLAGDSPMGTSNRALMLRRQLQNMDVDFNVPQGAKALFHAEQMALIQQPTPLPYIKKKPGPGGREFSFVPIALTIERLNAVFCYGWSFKVTDKGIITDTSGQPISVWVLGDMTITAMDGSQLVKSAFGGSEVEVYNSGAKAGRPLSVANNFKSAESDAIGKAASMFGMWLDLYDKEGDILKERIAAAEQTEAAIVSAATADAGNRTVEGRAHVVSNTASANTLLFDDPNEAAQAEQTPEVFEPESQDDEPIPADEGQILVEADEAQAALAAEQAAAASARAQAAVAAAAARARPAAPAPAKPAVPAPVAPAPATPAPASKPKHTPEELRVMSEAFFTDVVKMGWGLSTEPGKPNLPLIEKVLTARDATLWPLKVGTMSKAKTVLAEEAAKRRAQRAGATTGAHV